MIVGAAVWFVLSVPTGLFIGHVLRYCENREREGHR